MTILNNISFNFATQNKMFISVLYEKWDDFFYQTIEGVIEETLSAYDKEYVIKCIDKIDLDLGVISEDDFFEVFPTRLSEELKKAIYSHKQISDGVIVNHEYQPSLDILHFLIGETHISEWDAIGFNLQGELKNILLRDNRSIVAFVQKAFEERVVFEQMLLCLDKEFLWETLLLWMDSKEIQPDERRKIVSLFTEKYPYLFLALLGKIDCYSSEVIQLLSLLTWTDSVYTSIPLSLRQIGILEHHADVFSKDTIKGLQDKYDDVLQGKFSILLEDSKIADWLMDENITPVEKRKYFTDFVKRGISEVAEFVRIVSDPRIAKHVVGVVDDALIMQIIDILCLHPESVEKIAVWTKLCDYLLAYVDTFPSSTSRQAHAIGVSTHTDNHKAENKKDMSSKFAFAHIMINNAGLILLTPWFPRLFSMLGLLNEKGKGFKDLESKKRAVFIIQRVATLEERDYTMMDLIFNRILVGLPLGEPLPDRMHLTNEEMEATDSMLEGVKCNWPQMANTSVKGFQHSFIERKGVLEMQEERMLLTVELRSYDLLLDSLPWGYKLVRFPWLEKRIHVNWRDKE